MEITFQTGDPLQQTADAVILPASPADGELDLCGAVAQANDALGGELAKLATDAGSPASAAPL